MRFALGVDDDLGEFYRRFRRDPLLGPLIRRRPQLRPHAPALGLGGARLGRRQAADRERPGGADPAPHRRPLGPAPRAGGGAGLRDVPPAELIAGRAPAELEALGLSPARSIALAAVARQIAAGRCDPAERSADARLLAIPEIGPWTVQCLGLLAAAKPTRCPPGT